VLTPSSLSPVWRRCCCPLVPAAPSHLYPTTVPQRTSAAAAPHAVMPPFLCPGMASSKTAPSWAWLGRGEEWGQSCLPRSHTLPAGPAVNGTFWGVFFHLTHKISFAVIRKCISLNKKTKKQQLSLAALPSLQPVAISRCLGKNKNRASICAASSNKLPVLNNLGRQYTEITATELSGS